MEAASIRWFDHHHDHDDCDHDHDDRDDDRDDDHNDQDEASISGYLSTTMMKSMIMRMRMQRIMMEEWNASFGGFQELGDLNQIQVSYSLIRTSGGFDLIKG